MKIKLSKYDTHIKSVTKGSTVVQKLFNRKYLLIIFKIKYFHGYMNTFYLKHISLAIIHTTVLKFKYNSMLFIITTTLLTLPLCCLRFHLVILSVHACYIIIASVEMVWQCKTSLWTSCSGGSDALLLVNMDCNCMTTIPSS